MSQDSRPRELTTSPRWALTRAEHPCALFSELGRKGRLSDFRAVRGHDRGGRAEKTSIPTAERMRGFARPGARRPSLSSGFCADTITPPARRELRSLGRSQGGIVTANNYPEDQISEKSMRTALRLSFDRSGPMTPRGRPIPKRAWSSWKSALDPSEVGRGPAGKFIETSQPSRTIGKMGKSRGFHARAPRDFLLT